MLPDDGKVSKIKNWHPLTTTKEVRGFLGLCGTVQIWIKGCSQLAQPLMELWRKSEEFIWDQKRQEAFDTLKELVSSALTLNTIDYSLNHAIVLSVDTSWQAVGIILSQHDDQGRKRPAHFGSLPLNERES